MQQHHVPRGWHWFFGIFLITLTTVIWGYSNVVIRQGESTIAPSILLWARFAIAALIMMPVLFRTRFARRDWVIGLGTGGLLGIAVLAQGSAMLSVPVDEVAFITALYVVFTPIVMAILHKKLPHILVWFAVTVSLVGVTLMIGKLTLILHIGIIWSLVAAVAATGQIIGTTSLTRTVSSVQLAGLQSVGAGIFMTLAMVVQGMFHHSMYRGIFHWTETEWIWIGYLSILSTVVAIFLQSWGQAKITATEAALTFNMEPVWTAVFAWLILFQGMSVLQMIGAGLIVGSLTLVSRTPENG